MSGLSRLAATMPAAVLGACLMKDVYSAEALKFSAAELKVIYAAAGLKERKGKFLDECGLSVQPETEAIDLNGDGQAEVFVFVGSSCYGAAGGELSLLIKENSG